MPYVNIPESKLSGTIARLVGKLQGQVTSHALDRATEITNLLNREGCPNERDLRRLRSKKQSLDNKLANIDNRLRRVKRLPRKLRAPLTGLKAALKIILNFPIPQSVPPGFGLPVSITTKYADIMHLLKEFIKQISDDIEAISIILETPAISLESINRNLQRSDNALKSCEADLALQKELDEGNVSLEQLDKIGILNEDETFIFSTLGPKLLSRNTNDNTALRYKGKWIEGRQYFEGDIISFKKIRWSCTNDHISNSKGGKLDGLPGVGPWIEINDLERNSIDLLNKLLNNIDGSELNNDIKNRIKGILDTFVAPNEGASELDSEFFHTGPTGQIFKLEIILDPDSPTIAPKRFAVAKNLEGIIVLKGAKSFSSSTQVLLDEIKFRIDNQLP